MAEHHKESPSHYNAWAECPCWDGVEKDTAESSAGTSAHEELSRGLRDENYIPESYAARWAVGKVKELADGAEVQSEVRVEGRHPFFVGIYGTTDVKWVKDNVRYYVDFKTFSDGLTDYMPQLMGYAAIDGSVAPDPEEKVALIVLHGGVCKEEVLYTSVGECVAQTIKLLNKVRSGNNEPRLCKWCQYCAKIGECKASNNAVQVVNENGLTFGRLSLCQKLVVLDTVDKLSKTLRDEAKRMAVANGGVLEMDGIRYEMKPWAGKPKVRDLCEVAASVASPKYLKVNERRQEAEEVVWNGLTHEELLGLCDIGKSALADAIIAKNPNAVKADVNRYVEQFFDATEGAPHFVRTK